MPKVSKIGKFRKTAATPPAAVPAGSNLTAEAVSSKASSERMMSRGQRKRQAKRDQYLRREQTILSALQLKRKEEQSKRIDGLDSLREALLSNGDSQDTSRKGATLEEENSHSLSTNRSKKSLAAREVTHMNLVLQHPAYQSNPFATIQEHLKNTLWEQRQALQQRSDARSRAEEEQGVKRKQQKKEKRQETGGKHRKKFRATRRR